MKKMLLILGIIAIVIGVLCLLLGAFFGYSSVNTLDAPLSLFHKQRKIMLILLIAGVILIVGGILCLRMRIKLG